MGRLKTIATAFLAVGGMVAGAGVLAQQRGVGSQGTRPAEIARAQQTARPIGQKGPDPQGAENREALGIQEFVRPVPRGRERREFANEPGWSWLMKPAELKVGQKFGQADLGGIVSGYSVIDADEKALRIFFVFAQAEPSDPSLPEPRLVILDAAGKRYLPGGQVGGFSNPKTRVSNSLYTLDPKILEPSKAAYIGIERRMPPE